MSHEINPRLCCGQYAVAVAKQIADKLNWEQAPEELKDAIQNQIYGAYHVARVVCEVKCACKRCLITADSIGRMELRICPCTMCVVIKSTT